MSAWARSFVVVALSVAVFAFTILGGAALIVAQGQAQTCERAHGHWVEHYDSTSPNYNAWVDDKECRR